MPPARKRYDRDKVAEMLVQDFRRLPMNKVVDAVRVCEDLVRSEDGWEKLAECVKTYLKGCDGAA